MGSGEQPPPPPRGASFLPPQFFFAEIEELHGACWPWPRRNFISLTLVLDRVQSLVPADRVRGEGGGPSPRASFGSLDANLVLAESNFKDTWLGPLALTHPGQWCGRTAVPRVLRLSLRAIKRNCARKQCRHRAAVPCSSFFPYPCLYKQLPPPHTPPPHPPTHTPLEPVGNWRVTIWARKLI